METFQGPAGARGGVGNLIEWVAEAEAVQVESDILVEFDNQVVVVVLDIPAVAALQWEAVCSAAEEEVPVHMEEGHEKELAVRG